MKLSILSSFNRTILELKPERKISALNSLHAFNRTILELKLTFKIGKTCVVQ